MLTNIVARGGMSPQTGVFVKVTGIMLPRSEIKRSEIGAYVTSDQPSYGRFISLYVSSVLATDVGQFSSSSLIQKLWINANQIIEKVLGKPGRQVAAAVRPLDFHYSVPIFPRELHIPIIVQIRPLLLYRSFSVPIALILSLGEIFVRLFLTLSEKSITFLLSPLVFVVFRGIWILVNIMGNNWKRKTTYGG